MLEYFGLNKIATLTGLIGAALAALQGSRGRWERLVAFAVGSAVAIFSPQLVVEIFELKPTPALFSALGFFLGYFGFRLMDAVMQIDLKEIAASWLKKGG